MIDQLLFDCQVLAIIEEQAQHDNILRYGLQQKVKSFARKVVLSFNACGYASVSFGVPISMCSYSEERVLALNHLEKKPRIVKVIELAESLWESLRYVMPMIQYYENSIEHCWKE